MKYTYTITFCAITPILLIFVVTLMGGGHGTYLFTELFFPWGMIGMVYQDKISVFFIVLGILQYPVYGLLLDKFKNTPFFEKVVIAILLSHIILFWLIFNYSDFK